MGIRQCVGRARDISMSARRQVASGHGCRSPPRAVARTTVPHPQEGPEACSRAGRALGSRPERKPAPVSSALVLFDLIAEAPALGTCEPALLSVRLTSRHRASDRTDLTGRSMTRNRRKLLRFRQGARGRFLLRHTETARSSASLHQLRARMQSYMLYRASCQPPMAAEMSPSRRHRRPSSRWWKPKWR